VTHPDRISDLRLQDLLLSQLIEFPTIQLNEFVKSFLEFLQIDRSQSSPGYWRMRCFNFLTEMQENDRWIECYYLNQSNDKVSVSILDPPESCIIEITEKGRRDLRELQLLTAEEAKHKEEESRAIIRTKLSLLIRNYDYPKPRGTEAAKGRKHRETIAKAIATRRGQQKFRQDLLQTYYKCLVTGCDAEDALEAAHIRPYFEERTFELSNGLLLRADIHTLFDLGMIAVDISRMTVILSPRLKRTKPYGKLHGKKLQFPSGTEGIADKEALEEHRKEAGL
jgi:hypothetical protein